MSAAATQPAVDVLGCRRVVSTSCAKQVVRRAAAALPMNPRRRRPGPPRCLHPACPCVLWLPSNQGSHKLFPPAPRCTHVLCCIMIIILMCLSCRRDLPGDPTVRDWLQHPRRPSCLAHAPAALSICHMEAETNDTHWPSRSRRPIQGQEAVATLARRAPRWQFLLVRHGVSVPSAILSIAPPAGHPAAPIAPSLAEAAASAR